MSLFSGRLPREGAKFLVHPCLTAGHRTEQNTPCSLAATLREGSLCLSEANYLLVSQTLCFSTCKLHFLLKKIHHSEEIGEGLWESARYAPREKRVAGVDEAGLDLRQGITGVHREANKTRNLSICIWEKPWTLCREWRNRREKLR